MLDFLTLKEKTFGLDINDFSLKIVKLKKRGSSFVLVSFNEVKLKPGIIEEGVIRDEEALIKDIKNLCDNVKGRKLDTKYIVASLPEEKSFIQVIQMPKMKEEELKSAVFFEAENYIPFPIDDVYLDSQIIVPPKNHFNNLEVLIVAIPRKIVDSYVHCLRKAGLIPFILETEAQAISRALLRNEANVSSLVMIDFEETNADLIIYSGNSIRLTCSIPISSEKSMLDKLISQIKKYLDFYQSYAFRENLSPDNKIEQILVCGKKRNLKELSETISKTLKIPVKISDPWAGLNVKKADTAFSFSKRSSSFAAALGLALGGEDRKNNNCL